MNFQDEIHQDRLERINSIYYQFINRDRIDKSPELFNIVDVNGSDIISPLKNNINSRNRYLSTIEDRIKELLITINTKPISTPDNNIPLQWLDRINVDFNLYSYNQIYASDDMNREMLKYNKLVKRYIEICIEKKKLQIVIDSIRKDKTYSIPNFLLEKIHQV